MARLLAAPLACAAVLASAPAVAATSGRAAAAASRGNPGASFDRDCGFSAPIASGRALWLFCDTQVYERNGEPGPFIPGSTAAQGLVAKGEVPTLREVPTPPRRLTRRLRTAGPQQFLPPPERAYAPGGGPCSGNGRYAASWPSGLTAIPATRALLVVYNEGCIDAGLPIVEGLAMRVYEPRTNTLSRPYPLFKPSPSGATLAAARQLGSPIFSAGRLYMFSASCHRRDEYGDCVNGAVYLMRARARDHGYTSPAGYEWHTAQGWSRSARRATSIIAGATPESPAAVTVSAYPGVGLALISETSLGGGYQIWLAPSGKPSAGDWTPGPSAAKLPGCAAGKGLDLCRSLTGHPEISDSRDLLMSYFDPATGHVCVVAVPWRPALGAKHGTRGRSRERRCRACRLPPIRGCDPIAG